MCCIASILNKSFSELNDDDLKSIIYNFDLVSVNSKLKPVYVSTFTKNCTLFQNKVTKTKEAYYEYLKCLSENIGVSGDTYCDICGEKHNFDIDNFWTNILQNVGRTRDIDHVKRIGRDFFPTLGSASCSNFWPNSSRSYHICPKCLLAVQFIPISTLFIDGKLTCIGSSSTEIMQHIISNIFIENYNNYQACTEETMSVIKQNTVRKIIETMLSIMSQYKMCGLPIDNISIYLQEYFNGKDGVDSEIINISQDNLKFMYDLSITDVALKDEFLNKFSTQAKLFDNSIDDRKLYYHYPFIGTHKKQFFDYDGSTIEYYDYFQKNMLGQSEKILSIAKKIAEYIMASTKYKPIKQYKNVFSSFNHKNILKDAIGDMLLDSHITYDEYAELFNPNNEYLHFNKNSSYNLIRFYMQKILYRVDHSADN